MDRKDLHGEIGVDICNTSIPDFDLLSKNGFEICI